MAIIVLMVETVGTSETLVNFYDTTLLKIPEDKSSSADVDAFIACNVKESRRKTNISFVYLTLSNVDTSLISHQSTNKKG